MGTETNQELVAQVTAEVLRQTGQAVAAAPARKETGDIQCVYCKRIVKKGDTATDHISGCEGPTGEHRYRHIYPAES
jgi:hypothetical protein